MVLFLRGKFSVSLPAIENWQISGSIMSTLRSWTNLPLMWKSSWTSEYLADERIFWLLTHNLTHNRKRAGGCNGAESTIAPDFLEQKCPQSAMWKRFEGGQSVGKDEVSSSNLDSSSTKSAVF